jgi:uncharacterized damage-inducible protein DinB
MSRTNKFIRYFRSHRDVTLDLVRKIDEQHYDYKPTSTSMSAKELVTHMLTSFYRFALAVKKGAPSPFNQKMEYSEENLTELAEKLTSDTIHMIESITDDELNNEVDLSQVFGIKLTGRQLLKMAMDHEIHHKGNLFVYVREMGHTDLPMYVKKV